MKASKRHITACGMVLTAVLVMASVLVFGPVLAGGQTTGAAALAPGHALRLAAVDMDRVLNQSKEWQDCQEQRRRLLDDMRRTLKKYDHQLRILRSEYENLPPGTDAVIEKQAKIEAALRERAKAREDFGRQISIQRAESLDRIFKKISVLIERYAMENKIDLVLKKQDLRATAMSPGDMSVIIASSDVLYVSESFEVTNAIIEGLNAQYPGEIRVK